ncbi:adenosine deaminase [Arthrobacter antibioticus]|uniref:adenosine deaminase n=1 Tax=Arthrobacter sp. H35-MC1 TaxID=3046203 RepID=UPI0024B9B94F|nr:adenosine deaminase [Arthrobacter sp. H35-MC1]MDJ0316627.1 adenosine deaminase [Arthrobacter sp. H35-MC1]
MTQAPDPSFAPVSTNTVSTNTVSTNTVSTSTGSTNAGSVDLGALATLPKAELHLHIEGTLEPELILELAARNGITLPFPTLDLLREQYDFSDLQSFLNLYYANMAVLITEADFADMTRGYLRRAQEHGVRHAEIMFDPQAHLVRGVELSTAVNGIAGVLASSEADFGISTALIAAFLRDESEESALVVLEALLEMEAPIIGIGLDSAEVGNPPSKFIRLYKRAAVAGLRLVAHAGEEGPPSYVEDALNLLGIERIDHGIRAVEDKFLVKRLVAEQVPLTVCPLSNVRLRAVDTLAAHPLPQMIDAGMNVCVNSDDPAYFGGHVGDNFAALVAEFGWTVEKVEKLAANSIRSSFATKTRKEELLAELAQWSAGQG